MAAGDKKFQDIPLAGQIASTDTLVGVREVGNGVWADKRYSLSMLQFSQERLYQIGNNVPEDELPDVDPDFIFTTADYPAGLTINEIKELITDGSIGNVVTQGRGHIITNSGQQFDYRYQNTTLWVTVRLFLPAYPEDINQIITSNGDVLITSNGYTLIINTN